MSKEYHGSKMKNEVLSVIQLERRNYYDSNFNEGTKMVARLKAQEAEDATAGDFVELANRLQQSQDKAGLTSII